MHEISKFKFWNPDVILSLEQQKEKKTTKCLATCKVSALGGAGANRRRTRGSYGIITNTEFGAAFTAGGELRGDA